jgi:hypothetical protein
MKTLTATLHDGSAIEVEAHGSGPAILLPVNPKPIEGPEADEKRKWGVDPALGKSLIDGLSDVFTVVAFDYEGHWMAHPAPDTLTPGNIAKDFLAIADAEGAQRFAYYGYSWLALSGLQLAIRTDRLWALIMGGYPPVDGPYSEMLKVTKATHEMTIHPEKAAAANPESEWDAGEFTMSEGQARQFLTLYEALRGFDDRSIQSEVTCPRLCFAGSTDTIVYSERWGGATVDICGPLVNHAAKIRDFGWDVQVLEGLDHIQAMQPANVLPVVRTWLIAQCSSL